MNILFPTSNILTFIINKDSLDLLHLGHIYKQYVDSCYGNMQMPFCYQTKETWFPSPDTQQSQQ